MVLLEGGGAFAKPWPWGANHVLRLQCCVGELGPFASSHSSDRDHTTTTTAITNPGWALLDQAEGQSSPASCMMIHGQFVFGVGNHKLCLPDPDCEGKQKYLPWDTA